jgi:CarD family transcriptional regulator
MLYHSAHNEEGMNMYQIDDYVVYGEKGVCRIADICTPAMTGIDKDRKYYILHPLRAAGQTIYTPVDNDKVRMRKILSEKEAKSLINRIPSIETIWITNEKFREENYKKALRTDDCEEWIRIIKTLYLRRLERKAEGKSVTTTDERYFKAAESYLYDELSMSLGIPVTEVENYIAGKVYEIEKMKVLGYEESETD